MAVTGWVASSVRRRLDELRSGFWLVPTAFVGLSLAAAVGLIALDRYLQRDDTPRWIYRGGPTNASDTLTTIASSMITFTGLVFSITMVALQLTSSQFSPRTLRSFLRDRRSQVALGVFVATFAYAFAALAAVRVAAQDDPGFVPSITVTGALVLVAASVVVFVRLIHHTAHSLRVVTIIERIAAETRDAFESTAPRTDGGCDPRPPETGLPIATVYADRAGSITDIELEHLAEQAHGAGVVAEVLRPVGDFVCRGEPLVRVHRRAPSPAKGHDGNGDGSVDPPAGRDGWDYLGNRVRLGPERSMRQDPAFGLRQLVDIAERALSPGTNDPSTAVQCIDRIHDLLRDAATRPFPDAVTGVVDGDVVAWAPGRTFAQLAAGCLDELRHWGSSSLQVHRRVDRLLADLLEVTIGDPDRHREVALQRRLLHERRGDLPDTERARLGALGVG